MSRAERAIRNALSLACFAVLWLTAFGSCLRAGGGFPEGSPRSPDAYAWMALTGWMGVLGAIGAFVALVARRAPRFRGITILALVGMLIVTCGVEVPGSTVVDEWRFPALVFSPVIAAGVVLWFDGRRARS